MTTKEQNGFRLIKLWHLVLSIILILVMIGVNIGMTLTKYSNLEDRVKKLEEDKIILYEKVNSVNCSIDEIKINLKVLMEKEGLNYHTR